MATQLDEKIEHMQNMVEKWFDLHNIKIEYASPANHRPEESHESPRECLTNYVP